MTSMGGVADQAMTDFDVNNAYGLRALATFYIDTAKMLSAAPELLALYEALPFIGCQGDGEATGKWPTWEAFVEDVNVAWSVTKLWEEIEFLVEDSKSRSWAEMGTKESPAINRFFNRILMLEADLQNAMFETFFALYSELVRVDKQNGVYDEGIENLNRVQGRLVRDIKVDSKELLYKDPCSGAETTYIRLALDPGISWEAAKAAYDEMPKGGSVEGFYEYRASPESQPIYILAKETIQLGGAGATGTTWIARRRQRQFSIWRPDYGAVTGWSQGHKVYFEADLCGDRFSPVYGTEKELDTVKAAWIELYEKTAAKRTVMEHILTGDVLTAWQLVNGGRRFAKKSEDSADRDSGPKLQIVRATTQPDGLPVVGMRLREEDLPQLKYVLSCQQQAAELPNQKWLRSVKEACVHAAELLLQHLWTSPQMKMPYTSWLEVHKMLSGEVSSLRSVDGLRGTQRAVEKLQSAGLVKIAQGEMEMCPRSGGNLVKTQADLFKPLDPPPSSKELEELLEGSFQRQRSRQECNDSDFTESESEEEEADTQMSSRADDTQDTVDTQASNGKEARKKRRKLEERPAKSPGRSSKDAAMRQALFGDDDDAEFWGTMDSQEDSQKDEQARKRDRDVKMNHLLFGDLNEESDVEESQASKRSKCDTTDATESLQVAPLQLHTEAQPLEDEKRWLYEVVGDKKIRIITSASLQEGQDTGKELRRRDGAFAVSERLEGKDGRTYLCLADGRGWVYDRSKHDLNKVVVKEVSP